MAVYWLRQYARCYAYLRAMPQIRLRFRRYCLRQYAPFLAVYWLRQYARCYAYLRAMPQIRLRFRRYCLRQYAPFLRSIGYANTPAATPHISPSPKNITSAAGRCLFPLSIHGEGVADRPGVRSNVHGLESKIYFDSSNLSLFNSVSDSMTFDHSYFSRFS